MTSPSEGMRRVAGVQATVPHSDGTACMAGVWEQSAKLLQARAESAEAIIVDLWELIPPQEPSPELKSKVKALIARLENQHSDYDLGFGSLGEFESELHGKRIRTEDEIRDALKRMCDTVWGGIRVSPAFWHIPVNTETDVDCILYDAFTELKAYRAIFGPLPVRSAAKAEDQHSGGQRD